MNNDKKTARIVCAGEKGRLFEKKASDLVIAADGGLKYLGESGIEPDVVIGDFDSLGTEPVASDGVEIIGLPVEKDDTDSVAAVKIALDRGCGEIVLYCAAGGEIDHTIANLFVLNKLAGLKKLGYMYDRDRVITVISDESVIFFAECKGKISVFSSGERAQVAIKGLKYEFDGTMTNDFPLGAGNVFIGKTAYVYSKNPAYVVFPASVFENGLFERVDGLIDGQLADK